MPLVRLRNLWWAIGVLRTAAKPQATGSTLAAPGLALAGEEAVRPFIAVWIVAASACVAGPNPPREVEMVQAGTTAFANDQPAFEYFVGKGLTPFQAAGIVGNLDQESGVDPGAVQYGGGPGRGIAQWSVGGRWDTSTNDNVLAYASMQGKPSGSLDLQLDFIWYELTNIGYGFAQLKATTNVTDATLTFMDKYEICGTCASSQRIAYAQAVLDAYGATPPYGAKYVSQSWPLATDPLQIQCGETIDAKLVVQNVGSMPWDSSTRLATTMPRDRTSQFAGDDWLAPNRPAAVDSTVDPGANATLHFKFHAPTGQACVEGTYREHFGFVQEGVAWFGDSGQGGPGDDQIEAMIALGSGSGGGELGGGGGCAVGDRGSWLLVLLVVAAAYRRLK
jgi:hypothetical protein